MAKTRVPEIDRLYEEVLDYRKTKDFDDLLQFIARFRHVAPYNAMLVHIQKPGSQYVASATDWRDRFNRTIKPGARPLLILRPFGPVAFVFEYNDTEGRPLPDELINPFSTGEEIPEGLLLSLIRGVAYDGIEVVTQRYGTGLAGKIQLMDREKNLQVYKGNKIYTMRSCYSIVLNENLGVAEQFNTMLHELGHFYCGHLNYGELKWLPQRIGLSTEEVEFEAETVCWLVSKRAGVKSPSARYLSGYLKDNEYIPPVSVDTILKAAGMVETLLSGIPNPRKEQIIKTESVKTKMEQYTLLDMF